MIQGLNARRRADPSKREAQNMIILRSLEEIEKMRESNAIVAEILNHLSGVVAPGVTTLELDRKSEELCRAEARNRRSRDIADIPIVCALR